MLIFSQVARWLNLYIFLCKKISLYLQKIISKMNLLRNITGLFIAFQFLCYGLSAQDIHFSQFWASPLNLNPANTGQFEGDYRFVLNNKSQWLSFANAYSTFAGSIDAGFEDVIMQNSKQGVGFQINNDVAGDGRLATNQFALSTAFSNYWDDSKRLKTSLGFGASYTMNSVDYSNFRFGSQYHIDQYDPYAAPKEVWEFENIDYFSYNAGFFINYLIDTGFNINFGLAAFQINRPKKGFFESSESYLPVKWAYSLQAEYHIKDDLWAEPYLLFMHQQKYRELLIGGLLRIDYNPLTFRSFYCGVLLRTADAGIFVLGSQYQDFKLTISYDVNISGLTRISRGKGGFEFSLIYIIMKPRPFETPYYRKCPDFI